MTIAKTMTAARPEADTPPANLTPEQQKAWDAYYEPAERGVPRRRTSKGKDLVRWQYNRYMHDYLGCVKAVDESVGRVLNYLDDEGLAENTIVVYCVRPGLLPRRARLVRQALDLRGVAADAAARPLARRDEAGQRRTRTSSRNLDFAETFLDAAGVPVPADMQGRSLRAAAEGRDAGRLAEELLLPLLRVPRPAHASRPHYGVVTDRYKLVHFYEPGVDYWELFDLKTDPKELTSVYGKPEYADAQKELKAELARLRTELKVPDPDPPETAIKVNPKKKAKE